MSKFDNEQFAAGYRAYCDGAALSDCPWTYGWWAVDWARGWRRAWREDHKEIAL